jgi:hypothetical protein
MNTISRASSTALRWSHSWRTFKGLSPNADHAHQILWHLLSHRLDRATVKHSRTHQSLHDESMRPSCVDVHRALQRLESSPNRVFLSPSAALGRLGLRICGRRRCHPSSLLRLDLSILEPQWLGMAWPLPMRVGGMKTDRRHGHRLQWRYRVCKACRPLARPAVTGKPWHWAFV